MNNSLLTVSVCAVLAFMVGCGSKGPPTIPVSGTVNYKGAPLSGGSVRFNPVDPKQKDAHVAQGQIGSDGKFEVSTYSPGDGALAGDYNVTVATAPPDPNAPAAQLKANEKPAIPEKYADPKTSDLKVTVKPGEPINDLKLELKE